MSLTNELTDKEKRSIQRDINLIFSVNGITIPKTIEEFKELGFLPPSIKLKNRDLYLSKKGVASLRRICDLIHGTESYCYSLCYDDVYDSVTEELGNWFNKKFIPEGDEFTLPVETLLSGKINDYFFICRVDGISFDGIESITIGSKCIRKFDMNILKGANLHANSRNKLLSDTIKKEYSDSLVITGYERGSFSIAQNNFYSNADLSLSVLRLYSWSHYKHGIKKIKIRLINNCANAYGPASSFGWNKLKNSFTFTKYTKPQELEINSKILSCMKEECFFDEFSMLIEKNDITELEGAIIRSLYWLGEAQKDSSHASSWLKLWSCLECFFSIKEGEITKTNAKGITLLILHGGYIHDEYRDYNELKRKITKFYKLRSKIVHRAEYMHIDGDLVNEFSYLVSWSIITMVSLVCRGYTNLKQITEKADILDKAMDSN